MPIKRFDKEYWIACKDKDTGEMFRVKRYGRRVIVNGWTFYESRGRIFTEAVTGKAVPVRSRLEDIPSDAIYRAISDCPYDLMSLPIREDDDEND